MPPSTSQGAGRHPDSNTAKCARAGSSSSLRPVVCSHTAQQDLSFADDMFEDKMGHTIVHDDASSNTHLGAPVAKLGATQKQARRAQFQPRKAPMHLHMHVVHVHAHMHMHMHHAHVFMSKCPCPCPCKRMCPRTCTPQSICARRHACECMHGCICFCMSCKYAFHACMHACSMHVCAEYLCVGRACM